MQPIREIFVQPPFIRLDAFLKFAGAAGTGGQAKEQILAGKVLVNGEICLQRGKKLLEGDEVQLDQTRLKVRF